ncbi:hypothetical protein ACWCOP_08695 [Maricaulaceae bacterium MS644]
MSILIRAALAAGLSAVAATAAVLGADWAVGEVSGAAPGPASSEAAPQPPAEPPAELTVFDRFIGADGTVNRAAAANRACGFSESLGAGGTQFQLGDGEPGAFLLYTADHGEQPALRSYSAQADAVHAAASLEDGLMLQTAHTDLDGFNSRVFVLDETGYPTFSEPLLERARMYVSCDDPQAAASLLNAEFARSGAQVDPVRSGVRAFKIGDGVDSWNNPKLDEVVAACTPQAMLADMAPDQRFLLDVAYDEDARFGEEMVHEMSGESRAGSSESMVYLTTATVNDEARGAQIELLRAPLSWHDLLADGDRLSVVFRWEAIERVYFSVWEDGSRSHSESAGGVRSVDVPCADAETAVSLLEALRDEGYAEYQYER